MVPDPFPSLNAAVVQSIKHIEWNGSPKKNQAMGDLY